MHIFLHKILTNYQQLKRLIFKEKYYLSTKNKPSNNNNNF
jgi:hypothetical protein